MGIKACVGILIIDAGVKMIGKMPKNPLSLVITVCAFLSMLLIDIFALRVFSVTLMLAAALIGLAVFLVKRGAGKDGGTDK